MSSENTAFGQQPPFKREYLKSHLKIKPYYER